VKDVQKLAKLEEEILELKTQLKNQIEPEELIGFIFSS
jgi:hypothetical protein